MVIEFDLRPHFREHIAPRLDKLVNIEEEDGFKEEYQELMARGGRPIGYATHQGWGDGWPMLNVTKRFQELANELGTDFPGLVLPIARTISTGHYGLPLKSLYEFVKPFFDENGLLTVPYTREKDKIKFGLKRPIGETLRIARAFSRGYGVGYFPEASVQGGRHTNGSLGFFTGGNVNGMIEVDDTDSFSLFYDLMTEMGKVKGEIFFQPVAINGSYRFFGADIPIPTWELVMGGLFETAFSPVEVKILRPVRVSRLVKELGKDWKENKVGHTNLLMGELAKNLPEEKRGVFKNNNSEVLPKP